jgi:hypothetical protein
MRPSPKLALRLAPVAYGGVTLGILQGVSDVDYNGIWFEFLTTLFSLLVTLFFGGDLASVIGAGGGDFLT